MTATVSRKDRSASARSSGSGSSWVAHRARVTATDVIRPAPSRRPRRSHSLRLRRRLRPPRLRPPRLRPSGHHTAAPGLGRLNKRYVRPFIHKSTAYVNPRRTLEACRCDPSPTGPWPPRSGTRSATANTPTAASCPPRNSWWPAYSVSRQTVRRAMQDLVSEGIIYRVAGRGTYPVAEQDRYVNHFGSVEELMALSLDTECEVVSPLQRRVDVETASRLRLPSDEIFAVTLVRLHADVPFCYTSVYLPPRIGQLLTGFGELSAAGRRSRVTVIGLIDARTSGSITAAEQSVSAAGAPPFAARHLGCDTGRAAAPDRPPVLRRRGHPRRARSQLLRPRALLLPRQAPAQVAVAEAGWAARRSRT